MPSWEEYVAGTDPTDAVSRLAITGFSSWGPVAVTDIWTDELSGEICTQRFVPVDRAVLSWPSVSSRWYSLSASTGMCSGFQTAADGLAATPPENTYTTPPSPDQPRFYRLGVQRHE
jgi:hypothetical protein